MLWLLPDPVQLGKLWIGLRCAPRIIPFVWRALGSFSFGMVFRKQSDWLYQSNQPNRGYSCISELSFIGIAF